LNGEIATPLKKEVAAYLKIPEFALTIKKLDWLGLFDDKKLDIGTCSVFEMFAHTLQNKLIYHEGEKDLLIQLGLKFGIKLQKKIMEKNNQEYIMK